MRLGPSRVASRSPRSIARLTVAGWQRTSRAAVPVSTDRDPPTTGGVSTSRNKRNLAVAYNHDDVLRLIAGRESERFGVYPRRVVAGESSDS